MHEGAEEDNECRPRLEDSRGNDGGSGGVDLVDDGSGEEKDPEYESSDEQVSSEHLSAAVGRTE